MPETSSQSDRRGEESFLSIEAAAQQLAASLARLDQESDRHAKSAEKLDGATASTNELVAVVRDVGNQARQALEVVASAGGPSILKRIGETEQAVAALATKIDSLGGRLQQLLYGVAAAVVLLIVVLIVSLVK